MPWCNTDDLPASEQCYRRGHAVVPDELALLKMRIRSLACDALEQGSVYVYESTLKSLVELTR